MKMSVITATYNSEKTITNTLNSILNQTITGFEYVIIDGNSQDNTIKIIKEYECKFANKFIDFKFISESDYGIYDAWNKGLRMSKGHWVSFLGSDDTYVNNAIETYRNVILDSPSETSLIYSNITQIKNEKYLRELKGTWKWKIFRRYMNIAHVGSFHNKDYFETYGNFDTSYKIAGDYEMLLRAKQNLKTIKINKSTVFMGTDGLSNSNILNVFKETFRAKHETGKINKLICSVDFCVGCIKFYVKKLYEAFR